MTLRALLATYLLAGCCAGSGAATLVLSQLSDRPKKDFGELRPMVSYAAGALGGAGIVAGKVKLYKTFADLCQALRLGESNWVTETALVAARLHSECGAIPIAVKYKKRQSHYSSIIYTRRDSGIEGLQDLRGKRIALESQHSFSAYYLPQLALAQQGLELYRAARPQSPVAAGKTAYIFSRNEHNNVLMVLKAIAAAGAINDGDWNNPEVVSEEAKQQLRILHQSPPYPRSFELVSAKLAAHQRRALRQLLLGKAPGDEVLEHYERSSGFAPIAAGDIDTLKTVAKKYRGLN